MPITEKRKREIAISLISSIIQETAITDLEVGTFHEKIDNIFSKEQRERVGVQDTEYLEFMESLYKKAFKEFMV